MSDLYAGVVGGVWAGGTAGALVPPAGYSFPDLAAAYAAASHGDVIRLAPGGHTLPAAVAKAVRFAGYDRPAVTLTPAGGGTLVQARTVRFDALTLAAPVAVPAGRAAAFLGCDGPAGLATVRPGAAAVAVGCGGRLLALDGAAWAEYPAAAAPGGWPGRRASEYRTPAVLEAPAKRRNPDGQPVTAAADWLPVADLRVKVEEVVAREAALARVIAAEAAGRIFCRGWAPVHPDMRLRLPGDRLVYVKGVLAAAPPLNEFEVLYAERYG